MLNLDHITQGGISIIPESELALRKEKLNKILLEKQVEGMIFFSAPSIFYLTGIALMQNERPQVYVYKLNGDSAFLVPRMEYEHAHTKSSTNCKIYSYPEYPGLRHPMLFLADLLQDMKVDSAAMAADAAGAPAVFGYQGPSLKEICPDIELKLLPRLITELKIIKSDFEQQIMRETAKWGNLAQTLMQDYSKPGVTELEVQFKATHEASAAMLKALSPIFRLVQLDDVGIKAYFRGQIGVNTCHPHATTNNTNFKKGDMLGTVSTGYILGYRSELERTYFIGEPSKEQEHYYNLELEAQKTALSMIKPGNKCSDIDNAIMKFLEENNIMDTWRHHTGHCIGTGGHEPPFFDVGDHTVLEPGMAFSVEPGIYVEGLGGFRVSDTVIITETGAELITYYPRTLEDVIINV